MGYETAVFPSMSMAGLPSPSRSSGVADGRGDRARVSDLHGRRVIAWIDNVIDHFDTFMEAFAELGTTSFAAASPELYLRDFAGKKVDHLFLDYDLLGSSGFDSLKDILNVCTIKHVYVCTAYSYEEHIHKRARKEEKSLGVTIGLIPKERLPYPDQPERVSSFLSALDKGHFVEGPAVKEEEVAVVDAQLPSLSYQEYEEYTLQQRLQVLDAGRRAFACKIDGAFNEGVIWLAINASTGEIVKAARHTAEIPAGDWVDEYAEAHGAVTLVYSVGATLDSMDDQCRPGTDLTGYPRIGITRGDFEYDQKEIVHFDTGNSFTLLAYEHFLEHGWFGPIKNPEMRRQGGYKLYGKTVVLKETMVEDSAGNSAVGDIKGFAVMEWTGHHFAIFCGMNCDGGTYYPAKEEAVKLCRRRVALVGRNLGQEIDRRFMVDVVTGALVLRGDKL